MSRAQSGASAAARAAARTAAVALFAIAALAGAPAEGRAQVLRGVVIESTSRAGVAGAVVTVRDAAGRLIARTLSDPQGRFSIPAAAPEMRMRAQRIGYRAAELPAPSDGSDVVIELSRLPTLLEPRRVTASACGPGQEGELAVTLLDAARAGLLATLVAREAGYASMRAYTFQRKLDGPADQLSRMSVQRHEGTRVGNSFAAARPARDFIERGFREARPDGDIFFAPDLDVLVDDAFAEGYCFRVVPAPPSRPREVGLGFSAQGTRRARDRVDIDGTLWIDTMARALRDVEYRYTGLRADEARLTPGGTIAFRELPNGLVLIERWTITIAGTVDEVFLDESGQVVRSTRGARDRHLTGGEVAFATWPDGTAFAATLGAAEITAVSRAGAPAAGARLSLDRTPYAGVTDSTGRLLLDELLPGPYRVVATDTAFARVSLTMPTELTFTSARDTVRLGATVPTAREWIETDCEMSGAAPRARDENVVLIRALSGLGVPRASVRYTVRALAVGDPMGTGRLLVSSNRVDADGILTLCRDIRLNEALEIEARDADGRRTSAVIALRRPLTVIPILLP